MDNYEHEKELPERERRNSNTEYIPTKCRVTKPPPPKPATNPLQFVKVAPCPLFQKAQEQIKKVEEIKRERKEIREEIEDWQQNLDNWKSSRRKRQEHIIERVVEVKKLTEQEELEKSKRKSKTFSEMMERNRGRHKFSIPVYDDDSNDLSDYGIGSSSSKTNSIKDVDTDDSSSILDEKETHIYDSPSNRDSTSNQSQSEDETNVTRKEIATSPTVNNNNSPKIYSSTYTSNLNINISKPNILAKPKLNTETNSTKENTEQYTYEGAIQDYRSRIQTKIKVDESIFTKNRELSKSKEFSEAQTVLPKGEIFKRKGLFESEKSVQINHFETNSSRRLSEDFANSRSIKDRLKSLEKSADQTSKVVKNDIHVSVKQRLQNFNKQNDFDKQNNNNNNTNVKSNSPSKISNYLLDKSSSTPNFQTKKTSSWKNDSSDRCSSPETELYMNKLNMFNRDLDNLMNGKSPDNNLMDYCTNSNYAPSVSSAELTGISSDREDSGIHTADVSCSVSQADEPIDTDTDIALNTIPSCIEKLKESEMTQFEKDLSQFEKELDQFRINSKETKENNNNSLEVVSKEDISGSHQNVTSPTYSKEEILNITEEFLESLKKDASDNMKTMVTKIKEEPPIVSKETKVVETVVPEIAPPPKPKPAIYENIEFKPYNGAPAMDFITNDFLVDGPFSLTPLKMEPPKVKPPPPPPVEDDAAPVQQMKRMNSTKRIKKEMHIKRSSFLGLDEPTDDQIDPDIEKPPELNSFLQKESKLEKSLYKKLQEENRISGLSKVESQDSGLDIDRGRLSSDTWCSSVGDSSIPSHERQDSEQTNSITSEEDEITKKEREIIEMVEKEEQSRDTIEYVGPNLRKSNFLTETESISSYEPSLGSDQFNSPYIPQPSSDFLADQDSEVLKVEQELRQLEREELERQRENLLFRESRAKARLQNNRHSLENICDEMYPCYPPESTVDYRKSMPELQNVPLEYRKSVPDVPSYVYKKSIPDVDLQYRKSMPNIQHAYQKLSPEHRIDRSMSIDSDLRVPLDHRKSMPELQHDMHHSAFKSPPANRQPIMPGKPIRPVKDLSVFNPIVSPNLQHPIVKGTRQLSKHSLQALSAVPRSRHVPNDNWIQPKANPEAKNYNQHWVFQEAEFRRISDQQKNVAANRNWQQPRHEKHLPDSIIQSLTQRVQNRTNINERNQQNRRSDGSLNKEYMQHPYLGHPQTMGHALPTMPYSPPLVMEDSQDRILSVSGKKKCSYCGNELGRGAAMIIESLCLFYHMECFKCCVCHVQLGDGLMGTDVRVRNQKLHCHNCYSSDDGVKFSCV